MVPSRKDLAVMQSGGIPIDDDRIGYYSRGSAGMAAAALRTFRRYGAQCLIAKVSTPNANARNVDSTSGFAQRFHVMNALIDRASREVHCSVG
jgi:hypothetical protein